MFGKKYPIYVINDVWFDPKDGEELYILTTHFKKDDEVKTKINNP